MFLSRFFFFLTNIVDDWIDINIKHVDTTYNVSTSCAMRNEIIFLFFLQTIRQTKCEFVFFFPFKKVQTILYPIKYNRTAKTVVIQIFQEFRTHHSPLLSVTVSFLFPFFVFSFVFTPFIESTQARNSNKCLPATHAHTHSLQTKLFILAHHWRRWKVRGPHLFVCLMLKLFSYHF